MEIITLIKIKKYSFIKEKNMIVKTFRSISTYVILLHNFLSNKFCFKLIIF